MELGVLELLDDVLLPEGVELADDVDFAESEDVELDDELPESPLPEDEEAEESLPALVVVEDDFESDRASLR